MEDKFFTVKEVALNNHCPECYSTDGLRLTFKQKFVENTFYRAISKDTKHSIVCETCGTDIYPVQWTDDLERVVEYQERAFVPKAATFKLKNLTWIILVVVIAIVVLLNVYLFNN
ncbi:hypothetical protein M0G43_01230 [Subsaxibacter sp. CAU 1640]|uniref:hypothetical protein n=1 Tax=Subsaxibacter sp. CAU 1640 TaxID=2933271 RepID=UPI00200420F5|nr:hypothetical protein [Subsaxibacter sp. CAU 1640]MCK7589186.1 hypothetical protein [Subsaxibacter sp. CAU 1640]